MNNAIWATQIVLALVFLGSGVLKATWDRQRLVTSGQTGVQNLSTPLIRFIAFAELCGAIGLILPWAMQIVPTLTAMAAVGLAIIMVLAAVVHNRLGEPKNVALNIALLGMCLFVAWGRF